MVGSVNGARLASNRNNLLAFVPGQVGSRLDEIPWRGSQILVQELPEQTLLSYPVGLCHLLYALEGLMGNPNIDPSQPLFLKEMVVGLC